MESSFSVQSQTSNQNVGEHSQKITLKKSIFSIFLHLVGESWHSPRRKLFLLGLTWKKLEEMSGRNV